MRPFREKHRIFIFIGILVSVGFLTTSIGSYLVSRNAVQRGIVQQTLPLSSGRIYAEFQAQFLKPALISSMMSTDFFVHDWLAGGEGHDRSIIRYLAAIKHTYGTSTAFLISSRTLKYYFVGGVLKTLDKDNPKDAWFFSKEDASEQFTTEIDIDEANHNTTVFLNHRVISADGKFLGIAGVGLKFDALLSLIDAHHKDHFGDRIYFIDARRHIVLAGSPLKDIRAPIDTLPGIGSVAKNLVHSSTKLAIFKYEQNGTTMFVSSRYIPELDWHLIVEQNGADQVRPFQNIFTWNLVISAAVTLLVLSMLLLTVRRERRRLELIAGTDTLTGLMNRQAYNLVFSQAILDCQRSGRPLSCILFDIDFFKQVNDLRGHQVGDAVLRAMAKITRELVRESDIVSRWGGEEFVVLLKDCKLDQAEVIAEKLRILISQHDFFAIFPDRQITISLGVAQYVAPESGDSLFGRVDEALYKAKRSGRNCVQVALARDMSETAV
jgi:diguanylate cyclase (GGDEF)-like protein